MHTLLIEGSRGAAGYFMSEVSLGGYSKGPFREKGRKKPMLYVQRRTQEGQLSLSVIYRAL